MKFVNTINCIILILLTFVNAQQPLPVNEEKVTVVQVVGQAELQPANSSAWRSCNVGMNVRTGWALRTYAESEVQIQFASGTIVKVGENSVVTLASLKVEDGGSNTNIKIGTGRVWGNVKKLATARSVFEFETPTAIASIRGTRLGIMVTSTGTRVQVMQGIVQVRRLQGTQTATVSTQQQAVVTPAQTDIKVEALPIKKENEIDPFANMIVSQKIDSIVNPVPQTAAPSDTSGPPLKITAPISGSIIRETPVSITGVVQPGADLLVMGRVVAPAKDGNFSVAIELTPGLNIIPINAMLGDRVKSVDLSVEYRPILTVSVNNLIDGMSTAQTQLNLDINVSSGAKFSVNGKENQTNITLSAGVNTITVAAWNQWGEHIEKRYGVTFRKNESLFLNLSFPVEGMVISEPMIDLSGTTSPGAQINVNGMNIPVAGNGSFSTQLPIPDEPQEYSIEVVSERDGATVTQRRTVTYRPPKQPLSLAITNPVSGQRITAPEVRVIGKTSPDAKVQVQDRPVVVSAQGYFSQDIILSESNIGPYQVDVVAADESGEMNKTVEVQVDPTSPQINRSVPSLVLLTSMGQQATRMSRLEVQATDRTPQDAIMLNVNLNSAVAEYQVEAGSRQSIDLDPGKNVFSISAKDLARNQSNVISGEMYFLPGPLTIDLIDPDADVVSIEELPPSMGGVGDPEFTITVEINDGINSIPETIRSCTVTGNGRSILLKREGNSYRYSGVIALIPRGTNRFTIHAEDLAGNAGIKTISVIYR